MFFQILARALPAWARPRPSSTPEKDRARLRRVLRTQLSAHLLKDVAGEE
jgi:hypothetical protein